MNSMLRALPAFVAVLALSGAAHAEDSIGSSSSSSSAAPSNGIELTAAAGAGALRGSSAYDQGDVAEGLAAFYFSKSGHGAGLRASAGINFGLFKDSAMTSYDAVYAFRPWQAKSNLALVPTFWAGPGYMRAGTSDGTGWFNGEKPKASEASAVTAAAGASVDLYILRHIIVGVEGSGRVAIAGDDSLRGAVGFTALAHAGGELNF